MGAWLTGAHFYFTTCIEQLRIRTRYIRGIFNYIYLLHMRKIFSSLLVCFILFSGAATAQDKVKDTIYNVVDKAPVFPGDMEEYIRMHLHYPETALEKSVEGTVFVSFIVSKTGVVEDINVEKGVSEDLDAAAIKVVKNMPQWSPGIYKGTPVDVKLHLPIKFNINKNLQSVVNVVDKKVNFVNRKGFYVSPYLGLEWGSVTLKQELPVNPMGGGPLSPDKFNGSIEIGYMFNNHIGIFIAPQYLTFIDNYSFDTPLAGNSSVVGYSDYSFSNFEIPLLFKYITSKPGKLGLEISAGVNYEIFANGSENGTITEITTYPNQTTAYQSQNFTNTPDASKSNFGLTGNIALNVPINNVLSLSFGVIVSYELQSFGNGTNDFVSLGNGYNFNYYQREYGTANSYFLFAKLVIRIGKGPVKSSETK